MVPIEAPTPGHQPPACTETWIGGLRQILLVSDEDVWLHFTACSHLSIAEVVDQHFSSVHIETWLLLPPNRIDSLRLVQKERVKSGVALLCPCMVSSRAL